VDSLDTSLVVFVTVLVTTVLGRCEIVEDQEAAVFPAVFPGDMRVCCCDEPRLRTTGEGDKVMPRIAVNDQEKKRGSRLNIGDEQQL